MSFNFIRAYDLMAAPCCDWAERGADSSRGMSILTGRSSVKLANKPFAFNGLPEEVIVGQSHLETWLMFKMYPSHSFVFLYLNLPSYPQSSSSSSFPADAPKTSLSKPSPSSSAHITPGIISVVPFMLFGCVPFCRKTCGSSCGCHWTI